MIDMEKLKNKKLAKQKGFTIIELMISTIIFSLILLAASAAIVEVGKKYYRGITNARTQAVARSITEEIAQALQYTSQPVKIPNYPSGATVYGPQVDVDATEGDTFFFCIGSKRYTFAVDRRLTESPAADSKEKRHVFWVDEPDDGCAYAVTPTAADLTLENPSGTTAVNGRELLDINMRITKLTIQPRANGLWSIVVSVASGVDDLLALNDAGQIVCEGSTFGTEFCAVSEISLNVSKRIQ